MIRDKGQAAGSENQDNYEAAVLEFLDKEMAAAQSTRETTEQSDELDALVSDLLQQVISESDQQPFPENAGSEDLDDLVSEFQLPQESQSVSASQIAIPEDNVQHTEPTPEPYLGKGSCSAESVSQIGGEKDAVTSEKAEPAAHETKTLPVPASVLFAAPVARRSRMPLIAAALVCLAAGIGIPMYFFSGASTGASKPALSQPITQAPAVSTVQDQVKVPASSVNPAVSPAAPQVANNKPVTPNRAGMRSPASQKNAPASEKQTKPVSGSIAAPAPVREDKQAATPPVPVQPPVIANMVAEKPIVTVTTENTAPPSLVAERNSVTPIAVNSRSNDSLNLDIRPSATIHAIPRTMVAAVPVSQPHPRYPVLALRTRTSGTVVLDLEIDSQGNVTKATPVSGPELFREEAVNAVMKWRYKPASIGGADVPSQSRVTLKFNLPN